MVICTYFYDLKQPPSRVLCIKSHAIPYDILYSNLIHDYFGRLLHFMLWLSFNTIISLSNSDGIVSLQIRLNFLFNLFLKSKVLPLCSPE